MKRLRLWSVAALVASLSLALWTAPARAAGYGINEWGTRALGMANAVAADATTPDAVVFNPAGLAQIKGLAIQASIHLIMPRFAYTATPVPGQPGVSTRVDADNQLFPVPSLYVSYRLHDRVAVGLGAYARYGLGVRWPSTVDVNGTQTPWWGRAALSEVDLKSVWITPTVSVKLHDRVFIGGGVSIVQSSVYLKRQVVLTSDPADDVTVELSGADLAVAATGGVLFKAIPDLLHIGLIYRGGAKHSFDGNARFFKDGGTIPDGLRTRLVDGPGGAALTLPHQFALAINAYPIEGLKIGAEVDITLWSAYDALTIEFGDVPGAPGRAEQLSTTEARNWKNAWTVRIGGEYRVLPNLPVRLGWVWQQSPAPANTIGPELPEANRMQFTAGGGYYFGNFGIDLAYMFLFTGDSETADTAPLVGSYGATAHIFALGLSFKADM